MKHCNVKYELLKVSSFTYTIQLHTKKKEKKNIMITINVDKISQKQN